jgi:rhodanese-related sulfurtransferase
MNKPKRLPVALTIALLLLLAVATETACNKREASEGNRAGAGGAQAPQAAATQATPQPNGVRLVAIPELQDALEKGEAVVVDVRGSVEYKLGHIKGAISVPLGLIAQQIKDLPTDKLIVTYCACTHEQLSAHGVLEMKKLGIENAGALVGGWDAWVAAGLPTESSE